MPIMPNNNLESDKILSGIFPKDNEDTFLADAEENRRAAEEMRAFAESLMSAKDVLAHVLQGDFGDAYQQNLHQSIADAQARASDFDHHAGALEAAASNIAAAKSNMNGIDHNYHQNMAGLQEWSFANGIPQSEVVAARDQLFSEATQGVSSVSANFSSAQDHVAEALVNRTPISPAMLVQLADGAETSPAILAEVGGSASAVDSGGSAREVETSRTDFQISAPSSGDYTLSATDTGTLVGGNSLLAGLSGAPTIGAGGSSSSSSSSVAGVTGGAGGAGTTSVGASDGLDFTIDSSQATTQMSSAAAPTAPAAAGMGAGAAGLASAGQQAQTTQAAGSAAGGSSAAGSAGGAMGGAGAAAGNAGNAGSRGGSVPGRRRDESKDKKTRLSAGEKIVDADAALTPQTSQTSGTSTSAAAAPVPMGGIPSAARNNQTSAGAATAPSAAEGGKKATLAAGGAVVNPAATHGPTADRTTSTSSDNRLIAAGGRVVGTAPDAETPTATRLAAGGAPSSTAPDAETSTSTRLAAGGAPVSAASAAPSSSSTAPEGASSSTRLAAGGAPVSAASAAPSSSSTAPEEAPVTDPENELTLDNALPAADTVPALAELDEDQKRAAIIAANTWQKVTTSGWEGSAALAVFVSSTGVATYVYSTRYGLSYLPPQLDVIDRLVPLDLLPLGTDFLREHLAAAPEDRLLAAAGLPAVTAQAGELSCLVAVAPSSTPTGDVIALSRTDAAEVTAACPVEDGYLSRDSVVEEIPDLEEKASGLVGDYDKSVRASALAMHMSSLGSSAHTSALVNVLRAELRDCLKDGDLTGAAYLVPHIEALSELA